MPRQPAGHCPLMAAAVANGVVKTLVKTCASMFFQHVFTSFGIGIRQNKAGQDKTAQDKARQQDKKRQDSTRQDKK